MLLHLWSLVTHTASLRSRSPRLWGWGGEVVVKEGGAVWMWVQVGVGSVERRRSAARELLEAGKGPQRAFLSPTPTLFCPWGAQTGQSWSWDSLEAGLRKPPKPSPGVDSLGCSPHLWGHSLALPLSLKGLHLPSAITL